MVCTFEIDDWKQLVLNRKKDLEKIKLKYEKQMKSDINFNSGGFKPKKKTDYILSKKEREIINNRLYDNAMIDDDRESDSNGASLENAGNGDEVIFFYNLM